MSFYDLPGKTILMHNRCGVRIELNFDKQGELILWSSPQAGSSISYKDRNFSNRDDHTSIFDRIILPGCTEADFVKCEYDPFHSVVVFKERTLHVMTLFDQPVVLLWSDAGLTVDLKSDKQDSVVARDGRSFVVRHPDRGRNFTFAAMTDKAGASFTHQLQIDDGRSTYARIELDKGQRLALCGELSKEPVQQMCASALGWSASSLSRHNEELIARALQPGAFELNGLPRLQKMLDLNRRVLCAMQDRSGAIRAAINRIYYLIWVRDGAIIQGLTGHTGSAAPLADWTRFLLANPLEIKGEEPEGTTFGMLVNKISKWEEDGVFYAIWSAFTAWTQTGDRSFISGKNLETIESAMVWLEKYCFVKKIGLFGRYFACETPFPGSRDDGFDNAVGKMVGKSTTSLNGKPVKQSFDVYINLLSYSSYVMLAGMTSGTKAAAYLAKADALAKGMDGWFDGKGLPTYGLVRTSDGKIHRTKPYELDTCDYVWAFTVPPFFPVPGALPAIRAGLHATATAKPKGYFLSSYFTMLAGLDTDSFDEKTILKAVAYAEKQCHRPGKMLAMPDTVVEMLDIPDGHLWHDVRPQAFSISPWLATMTGLGVRRLPYGIAFRATQTLKRVPCYEYKGARIDIAFKGKGKNCLLGVNGRAVPGSLQLPESLLVPGDNVITVQRTAKSFDVPVLISSTITLSSVQTTSEGFRYFGTAHGKNVLEFRKFGENDTVTVKIKGKVAVVEVSETEGLTYVAFDGQGEFVANVMQG